MDAGGKVTYRVGDLLVDLGRGQVTRDGLEVPLPKLSFHLFVALIRAAPDLVTQDELMAQVWPGLVVTPETVSQRAKLLRQSLGDDPRQPRYFTAVRGRGYRLVAPVEIVPSTRASFVQGDAAAAPVTPAESVNDPTPTASVAPAAPAAESAPDGMSRLRRRTLLGVGALVAVALLAVGLASRVKSGPETDGAPPAEPAAATRPVVAVLPFVALGESRDPLALSDGLQSDILTELSRVRSLDVIAATSVEQFRGSKLDAREIGRRLGASHILEGGVQRVGPRVRINAQLIEARSQSHVWAETYDRDLTTSNLFSVQGEIAADVAEALQAALSADERGDARAAPTVSIDAWAAERAGRVQLERRTTRSLAEAERLFRRAIELDPKFGRAYAGLADAVWLRADQEGRPWFPAAAEAERLVNVALRLDPGIPEAWATRAKLAHERFDFDTAEVAYQRTFELSPSYARAHSWYAQFLEQLGRNQDSRAAALRASELDPMSAPLLVNAGLAFLDPADPTEALAYMDKARALDPEGWLWAEGKGIVLAFAGRFDEALHWHLEALRLDPRSGYALAGVAHWHLELDDLAGAKTWFERATADGREIAGAFGHAALLHLYSGEPARAVAFARRGLAYDPRDPKAFMVIDAEALRRGDTAAVVTNVHSSFPELAAPGPPRLLRAAVLPATDLALALRLAGDAAASDALLEAVARFLDAARRHGSTDFVMDEIRVAAVRGERDRALQLLDDLVAAGWRGAYWRYFRDHDPALDSLRTDPRFRAAFARVESDIRAQRARAAKSGDLGRLP